MRQHICDKDSLSDAAPYQLDMTMRGFGARAQDSAARSRNFRLQVIKSVEGLSAGHARADATDALRQLQGAVRQDRERENGFIGLWTFLRCTISFKQRLSPGCALL